MVDTTQKKGGERHVGRSTPCPFRTGAYDLEVVMKTKTEEKKQAPVVKDFGSPAEFRPFFIDLVWESGKAFAKKEVKAMFTIGGKPVGDSTSDFFDLPKHKMVSGNKELLLKWAFCATQIDVRPRNTHVFADYVLPAAKAVHKLDTKEKLLKAADELRTEYLLGLKKIIKAQKVKRAA